MLPGTGIGNIFYSKHSETGTWKTKAICVVYKCCLVLSLQTGNKIYKWLRGLGVTLMLTYTRNVSDTLHNPITTTHPYFRAKVIIASVQIIYILNRKNCYLQIAFSSSCAQAEAHFLNPVS